MSNEKKKKPYEAPAIIHEEVVEAIASTCDSSFGNDGTCRISTSVCSPATN